MREVDEGGDAAAEAASAVANTEPTTVAGVRALLTYFANIEVVDNGMAWPDHLDDADDPLVTKHGGASMGYFVARTACRALSRIAQAQS